MNHRAVSLLLPVPVALSVCCVVSALACLEPPQLEPLPPPLADLGGLETWGPLDGAPTGAGESPGADEGPTDPNSETGADPGQAPSTSADPGLLDLRLTEVLADPDGKDGAQASPEFIELLNTGHAPVALAGLELHTHGWPVVDAPLLGVEDAILEVGGVLVVQRWTKDEDPSLTEPRLEAGVWSTGFLHNDGLRNDDGFVAAFSSDDPIDGMVYGSSRVRVGFAWAGLGIDAPGSGEALCRVDLELDTDAAGDWSGCSPSPGHAQAPAGTDAPPVPAGALAIVEVSANPIGPSSDEKYSEFIEIVNISEIELELGSCSIGDALEPDAPGVDPLEHFAGEGGCASLTCLAPGRRALLVGDGYTGPQGDALILAMDDSTIADGGLTNTEPLSLWNGEDELVASYRHWSDPQAAPVPTDGQALHRVDPFAADEPGAWIAAEPTPGT